MCAVAALWLDVVLNVEIVHVIEPPTETARGHDDIDVMGKFLLDPRCSELAFVAGHGERFFSRATKSTPAAKSSHTSSLCKVSSAQSIMCLIIVAAFAFRAARFQRQHNASPQCVD